jgi:hypothetical protein
MARRMSQSQNSRETFGERIQKHPLKVVAGACTAVGIIIYGVVQYHSNKKIEVLNEQLKSKDIQVDILKEQVKSAEKQVSQNTIHIHERLSALEQQIRLLGLSTQIFPTTGGMRMGNMVGGSPLEPYIVQAREYISQKQFDLALKKSDEMQDILPGFHGSAYIKYLVNREKGFDDEAAKYAKELLLETPLSTQKDEARISVQKTTDGSLTDASLTHVYKYLTEYLLKKNHKKEAEDLALRALFIWQDSPVHSEWVREWKGFFQTTFGYLPARKP